MMVLKWLILNLIYSFFLNICFPKLISIGDKNKPTLLEKTIGGWCVLTLTSAPTILMCIL